MGEYVNNPGTGSDDVADVNDFSWNVMTKKNVDAESNGFCSAVNKVTQLIHEMYTNNDYNKTAIEVSNLCNGYLGRRSWIQEFYYANQSTFASLMRGDSKPSWFFDMTPQDQIAFDYGLKCQKAAAECCKPLDQIWLLLMGFPLQSVFQLVRATINLDDAGFDEDLYKQVDDDIRQVSAFINKDWDSLERITNAASEYYYKQNQGKLSPRDLQTGYRKARLKDYRNTFQTYYPQANRDFTSNDYCTFSTSLNYYVCMQVVDEYMKAVAKVLKEDLDAKLENCIKESKKLTVVINSRMGKFQEEAFNASMTAVEALNQALCEISEMALNMCKNYKGLISAAPYCFMKKPPSSESLNSKYSLKPMGGNPLSDGTQYAPLISAASSALTQHCRDFVYSHGRKDMIF